MMKYLLLPLLLAAGAAHAQYTPPPPTEAELRASGLLPSKGVNTIVITTPDSGVVAYSKLAKLLLSEGYTLDRADKELLFLNTKSRPAPKLNVIHAISGAILSEKLGSRIQLKSTFSMPGAAAASPLLAGETQTQYRGMSGSPAMICWSELQRIASLYPGGRLSYIQQH